MCDVDVGLDFVIDIDEVVVAGYIMAALECVWLGRLDCAREIKESLFNTTLLGQNLISQIRISYFISNASLGYKLINSRYHQLE